MPIERVSRVTEELFCESFLTEGMKMHEIHHEIEFMEGRQTRAAAERARNLLVDRGFFNGEIKVDVKFDPEMSQMKIVARLICYGLPHKNG